MIFSWTLLPAMRASAPPCSMPAWPTLRLGVTPGSIGSRPKTTVRRSGFTTGTAAGAVPGSRTAQLPQLGSNAERIGGGGSAVFVDALLLSDCRRLELTNESFNPVAGRMIDGNLLADPPLYADNRPVSGNVATRIP